MLLDNADIRTGCEMKVDDMRMLHALDLQGGITDTNNISRQPHLGTHSDTFNEANDLTYKDGFMTGFSNTEVENNSNIIY